MRFFIFLYFSLLVGSGFSQNTKVFAGADQNTPSKAQYFSWINNTNEGSTEAHTQINLDFFAWLKKQYAMQLDIYAFDAGALDGKRFYGSMASSRFKAQFPYAFDSIYKRAKALDIRLGIWGGPDGFGTTKTQEKARIAQMVRLCKQYNFALFKFDAVCGPLPEQKEDAFIQMMQSCRTYSPDLILLNHRLGLKKAKPYATTFLWAGAETYIDVFMNNTTPAPHHRAGALARGLVPDMQRLTEDHGVCISSCLDYWQDDLVLQAFNRNLILSPQIYGNPWLLQDAEFAVLARIFNIHKKYKTILTKGMILDSAQYGKDAVSRGDTTTRIITLKNLSWESKTYTLSLNEALGLAPTDKKVSVVALHPLEQHVVTQDFNTTTTLEVAPFRAAMFLVTTNYTDPLLKGVPFRLTQDIETAPIAIDIKGLPGTKARFSIANPQQYKSAWFANSSKKIALDKLTTIRFPGKVLKQDIHRKLQDFHVIPTPKDAGALYEATVFSADNNALEVRALKRSGPTKIPQVQAARDAFFNQKAFVDRGIWDKNLFDDNLKTAFFASRKYHIDQRVKKGTFRLDLGALTPIDTLEIMVPDDFSLQPLLVAEGNYMEVSSDLKTWRTITYIAGYPSMKIAINDTIRYIRCKEQPGQIVEINGYYKGQKIDRSSWRASNLFAHASDKTPVKTWKSTLRLPEIAANSYISVALHGKHGVEGAYVAAKIDGKLVGAFDRAVSYPSNTWEYVNARSSKNYTYYIPVDKNMAAKKIELFVFAYDKDHTDFMPKAWISSTNPYQTRRIYLSRK